MPRQTNKSVGGGWGGDAAVYGDDSIWRQTPPAISGIFMVTFQRVGERAGRERRARLHLQLSLAK